MTDVYDERHQIKLAEVDVLAKALQLDTETVRSLWNELERALEGKNGFGGNVAEIYAYRCMPPAQELNTRPSIEDGILAARNLTRILRAFADYHRCQVGVETDARVFEPISDQGLEPFTHRVHIEVTMTPPTRVGTKQLDDIEAWIMRELRGEHRERLRSLVQEVRDHRKLLGTLAGDVQRFIREKLGDKA